MENEHFCSQTQHSGAPTPCLFETLANSITVSNQKIAFATPVLQKKHDGEDDEELDDSNDFYSAVILSITSKIHRDL